MPNTLSFCAATILCLTLAGCADARRDPCQLLTVGEVHGFDASVTTAVWAGAAEERTDGEVCVFYTGDGYPRMMLFFWYDEASSPEELVTTGSAETDSDIVDVPGVGSEAAAAFAGDEMRLLAVRSSRGTVGLRVKRSVMRGSAEFDELARLAEEASLRYQ